MQPTKRLVLVACLTFAALVGQSIAVGSFRAAGAFTALCDPSLAFTCDLSPGQITIPAGTSGMATLTLSSGAHGFAGTIKGSVSPKRGWPYGIVNPSTVTLKHNTQVQFVIVVVTTPSTPQGAYSFTFNMTGSSIPTQTLAIPVNVVAPQNFGIYNDNPQQTLPMINVSPGTSSNSTVQITSFGTAGNIGLSASATTSGLSGSVTPNPVSLNPGSTTTATVSVSAPASQSFGSSLLFVNATSGSTSHFTVFGVKILPSFNMTFAPSPLAVPQGASETATLSVNSNGFPYPLSIEVGKPPFGLTAELNPANFTVSPQTRVQTATLTVWSTPVIPLGSYSIDVVAQYSNSTSARKQPAQTLTLAVNVVSPSTRGAGNETNTSALGPLGRFLVPTAIAAVAAVGVVTAVLYRRSFRPSRSTTKPASTRPA